MRVLTGFKRLRGALDNELGVLVGSWAIGGTGAVGAKTGGAGMVLSRSNTGLYSLQLTANGQSATVPAILYVSCVVVNNDADPSNDTDAINARPLTAVASTGVVTLQTFDEAGASRDPASGAALQIFVVVKMSNVIR